MDEIIEKIFFKQQTKSWEKNKTKIIEYIKSIKDEFKMHKTSISIEDIKKRIDNPQYMSDIEVDIKDGINIIFSSMEIWNEIKIYIPKTITKMTIPSDIINKDYEFLSTFPNLKEIFIPYYRLDSKVFTYINNNTSVNRINSEYIIVDKDDYVKNTNTVLVNGNIDGIYADKLVVQAPHSIPNRYLIIDSNSINTKDITNVLENEDLSIYDSLTISDKNSKLYDLYLEKNKLTIYDTNNNNIAYIIKLLTNKGINLNEIEINVTNIDYTLYDFDKLSNLVNTANVVFKYEIASHASYEDFMALIETIKWYRSLLADYDLSPVEKLMFAYDIMKTYSYRENENDKSMARYPDKIIKSGDIVCVGYASFLKEILKYIDPGIGTYCASVMCKTEKGEEGHERNLVRIDDDKYNIHGIYIVDATWDSVKNGEKTKSVLGYSYNALDLYTYFLIPYEEYENTFVGDTMPSLYKYVKDQNSEDPQKLKFSDWPVVQTLKSLFEKNVIDENTTLQYLSVKRP